MIKNLSIRLRLSIAFGLVLILLLAATLLGISRLRAINDITALIASDRYPKVMLGTNSLDALKDIAVGQRNMLILEDTQAIANEKAAILEKLKNINSFLGRLEANVTTDKGRQIFNVLHEVKKNYEADLQRYLALIEQGEKGAARNLLMTGMAAHQAVYLQHVHVLIGIGGTLMNKSSADAADLYLTSTRMMIFVVAVALLLSGGMAYWISRSITAPLARAVFVARSIAKGDLSLTIDSNWRDETGQLLVSLNEMNDNLGRIVSGVRVGSDVISTSSGEIAHGTMDLSSRTEQQAASLEETAASMEQLTSTVRQNASQAQEARQIARLASQIAVQGGNEMSEITSNMAQIRESSQRIAAIIGVIDGIAFQTNILALNAAVEAARAGEQGRGFAVVAGEVRSLAQRAAAAAKEIKQLIDDSTEKVDAGDRFAGKISITMNRIVEEIGHVSAMVDAIDSATQEQMAGIDQVNLAITQMDQATQQNAALVEEAAAAAASMQDQTRRMAASVHVFVLK